MSNLNSMTGCLISYLQGIEMGRPHSAVFSLFPSLLLIEIVFRYRDILCFQPVIRQQSQKETEHPGIGNTDSHDIDLTFSLTSSSLNLDKVFGIQSRSQGLHLIRQGDKANPS